MSSYSSENIAELNVLMLFHDPSSLEGIKVHKEADPVVIAATRRLFDGGFITQHDGGYLTPLGVEAAELTQSLFTMLNAHKGQ